MNTFNEENNTVCFVPLCLAPVPETEALRMAPGTLSFIGDAVHSLYVRTKLSYKADFKLQTLHNMASDEVKATSQAAAVRKAEPLFTENEMMIYKRCRNAHHTNTAKNASVIDYNLASGLEGVIGFLYVTGNSERLNLLLTAIY